MTFSKFFIDRPVFALVVALIIVFLGYVAMSVLPISQFPKIIPPTVVVSASYPGADAQTISNNVIAPIEEQIAGASKLMYLSSSAVASSSSATITCTFEVGTNIDMAVVDIQNRVNLAQPFLPSQVKALGINVKKKTQDILLLIALYSPDESVSDTDISNYATNKILGEIKRIPGAGESQIFGQRDYAMRIWLNPDKMATMGITTNDIDNAILEQNLQISPGRLGQSPSSGQQLTIMLRSKGRLSEPKEFENIILKTKPDGTVVHIKDVARVEIGNDNYEFYGRLNSKPAALLAVFAQSDANALETAYSVIKKMDDLSKNFPKGISHKLAYDTTEFVKISIHEVILTLFISIVLVVGVIYVFLQSYRASIIALAAVPVSLMGAFIGMYLLDYSINTLTLFGMVLAIGVVVDDAIVVVENMERIMQSEHIGAREASIKAMSQVASPIVAIVLVMCSVFVPATFVGGMTGELYKQFAMTIAVSVVFSGFVALSLSPALGARLLKAHQSPQWAIFARFNAMFERLTERYIALSSIMIRRWFITAIIYSSVFGVIYYFSSTIQKSFVPQEDQGFFFLSMVLPEGATIERTQEVVEKAEKVLSPIEGVVNIVAMVGNNMLAEQREPNAATMAIRLKHWDERQSKDLTVEAIMSEVKKRTKDIKEANFVPFSPPPIRGLGTDGSVQLWIQSTDSDIKRLASLTQKFVAKAKEHHEFANVMSKMRPNTAVFYVDVDREKAKTLGVSITDVFNAIQNTIGVANVNQFDRDGRTYWVKVQSDEVFRKTPSDISRVYVKSQSGAMIRLDAFVTIKQDVAPAKITHFNSFLGNQVMATPISGVSSGEAMEILEKVAAEVLPSDVFISWDGVAFQQKKVADKAQMILAFAFIMVFLIIAAQYEAWMLPLAIILAVPFGISGAYAAVWIAGQTNDVYFQIGLLTLVALASKNAILVTQFAEELRKSGKSVYDATISAARIRYRPMMMTSLAFVFGVLPLVLSSGAGAASRHSIGVGILGGMLAATFIERYFIPYLYFVVASIRERFTKNEENS